MQESGVESAPFVGQLVEMMVEQHSEMCIPRSTYKRYVSGALVRQDDIAEFLSRLLGSLWTVFLPIAVVSQVAGGSRR